MDWVCCQIIFTIFVYFIIDKKNRIIYTIIRHFAVNGGLVSEIRLLAAMHVDYLFQEAAMSLYEFLDLLFTAIQLFIDIIQCLLRRRKKGKNKK